MKLILKGGAQSGKDTVGAMYATKRKGLCIAQADPMKRFAMKVFEFSEETLWGPSDLRNVLVRETEPNMAMWWAVAEMRFNEYAHTLFKEVLPGHNDTRAWEELRNWFSNLRSAFQDSISARVMLQTIGTEWGRLIDPDMWNRWALNAADRLTIGGCVYNRAAGLTDDSKQSGADAPNLVIITDGRFRNEVQHTRDRGGMAVQVIDPNAPTTGPGIKGHRSEEEMKSIPSWWFNLTIINDKTKGLQSLEQLVDASLGYLMPEAEARDDDDPTPTAPRPVNVC